jgi:hypothetical protein
MFNTYHRTYLGIEKTTIKVVSKENESLTCAIRLYIPPSFFFLLSICNQSSSRFSFPSTFALHGYIRPKRRPRERETEEKKAD